MTLFIIFCFHFNFFYVYLLENKLTLISVEAINDIIFYSFLKFILIYFIMLMINAKIKCANGTVGGKNLIFAVFFTFYTLLQFTENKFKIL